MAGTRAKGRGLTRILAVVAVLAVVAALVLAAMPDQEKKYVTASFPRTVSLYEGSDVRILGVPVGKVESVRPSGTDVTVKMWYDAKYDVPSDAQAVIISPAIVGDRFIQLTPVFKPGDKPLDSHAVMSTESTSTPLELDEIYQSIDDLTVALGPNGANREGALTSLLNSTAENFAGQGEQFHQTIKNLGKFTGTLDNNKEELFGTAREIERFVNALAKNDGTVRDFNDSLASAADLLKDERSDLAAALRNLGVAMKAVESFVRENRTSLSQNITGLNKVSKVLVRQRDALDEILQVAPTALTNLFHTYNPATGTLDTRTNLGENIGELTSDPARIICGILNQTSSNPTQAERLGRLCTSLGGALGRSGALRSAPSEKATDVEHIDRSLGGVVDVKR